MNVLLSGFLVVAARQPGYEKSFLQELLSRGPLGLFFLGFSVFCTMYLIYARVRGCFRPQPATTTRDIALLFCAPVLAVLETIRYAIVATQAYLGGGFDADFGIRYGLTDSATFCVVAIFCFIFGVTACLLPSKKASDLIPGESHP